MNGDHDDQDHKEHNRPTLADMQARIDTAVELGRERREPTIAPAVLDKCVDGLLADAHAPSVLLLADYSGPAFAAERQIAAIVSNRDSSPEALTPTKVVSDGGECWCWQSGANLDNLDRQIIRGTLMIADLHLNNAVDWIERAETDANTRLALTEARKRIDEALVELSKQ